MCVCVLVTAFPYSNKSDKKTYKSPQRCKRLNKNERVFVKQPLRKATKFTSKQLAHLSAILVALASTRVYFNHVTLLSTRRCLNCPLCHCFGHSYIYAYMLHCMQVPALMEHYHWKVEVQPYQNSGMVCKCHSGVHCMPCSLGDWCM